MANTNRNIMSTMMISSSRSHFYQTNKKWPEHKTDHADSLLGMTASLFEQKSMFSDPPSSAPSLNEITSNVLAELADHGLLDAPTADDIFEDTIEPVPFDAPASDELNFSFFLQEIVNQALGEEFLLDDDDITLFAPALPPQQVPSQMMNMIPGATPLCTTAFIKRACDRQPQVQQRPVKRQRVVEDEQTGHRFRTYQAEQWSEKFDELIEFMKERGHCSVPHTFEENPALARWVKRQRYQYKLLKQSKASTLTNERVIALDRVGFVWDSHSAAWNDRLNEYRRVVGHCDVPIKIHPSNSRLATWVKCQRRQYKLFWGGKLSNMTLGRISELEKLGFQWDLPRANKASLKKSF
jgi:hypothetical protein